MRLVPTFKIQDCNSWLNDQIWQNYTSWESFWCQDSANVSKLLINQKMTLFEWSPYNFSFMHWTTRAGLKYDHSCWQYIKCSLKYFLAWHVSYLHAKFELNILLQPDSVSRWRKNTFKVATSGRVSKKYICLKSCNSKGINNWVHFHSRSKCQSF